MCHGFCTFRKSQGAMSSPNLIKARQALAAAREKRRASVESRTRGQRLAQMACSAPPTPAIQRFFRDVNTIHQARIRENHTQAEILDNMLRNLFVSESRTRYTAFELSTDQFENLRTTILHMARASEHKRKTQSISSSSVSPASGTQILSRIAHRKVS